MRLLITAIILSLPGGVLAEEADTAKVLPVTESAGPDHAAKLAMDDRMKPLLNRRTAFGNRPYWWELPRNLPFDRFIPISLGAKEQQKIQVVEGGWIHIALANQGPKDPVRGRLRDTDSHVTAFAKKNGFEKTDMTIGYRVPLYERATRMFVYRKKVPVGELKIRRVNWSGPVILIP